MTSAPRLLLISALSRPCLSRPRHPRLGRVRRVLLAPTTDRPCDRRTGRWRSSRLFSDGNLSPGEREDRSNRWVLAAFGVIGLLAAYLPA